MNSTLPDNNAVLVVNNTITNAASILQDVLLSNNITTLNDVIDVFVDNIELPTGSTTTTTATTTIIIIIIIV